jgi:hypothetical protein
VRWPGEVLSTFALGVALSTGSPSAHAADPVTDAMQAAYVPYRAALFRTNGKAQVESERAIAEAVRAWQAVVARFVAAPPVPYAGDPRFAATLAQVSSTYGEAEALIKAGKLPEAHEELEKVRDLLAALRQRNGVVVFSDAMNAYHEVMEHVLVEGPALVAAPQGAMELMARVGALGYLAERLESQAPADLASDPEFVAARKAVVESVVALRAATLAQDRDAMRKALGGLKAPYSRLFLRFG